MNSMADNFLDGNAAAGELSKVFAVDITVAEGQCAHCGTTALFAGARVYMGGPGLVARCAACGQVLLRAVTIRQRVLIDMRGMAYLTLKTLQPADSA